MKIPVNHILVAVDLEQKNQSNIGDVSMKTAKRYNENFRERNPVVAKVVSGLGEITEGCHIVCNYNYFDESSPYQLYDNLFCIPVDEEIFAIINDDGSLSPIGGNILVERVTKDSPLPLPDELKKPHTNQGVVACDHKRFKKGTYVLWQKMADYGIVFTWNAVERRAIKIHESEIVGFLKN